MLFVEKQKKKKKKKNRFRITLFYTEFKKLYTDGKMNEIGNKELFIPKMQQGLYIFMFLILCCSIHIKQEMSKLSKRMSCFVISCIIKRKCTICRNTPFF